MPNKWVEAQDLTAGSPILSLPITCRSWELSHRQGLLAANTLQRTTDLLETGKLCPHLVTASCSLPPRVSVMDKQKTLIPGLWSFSQICPHTDKKKKKPLTLKHTVQLSVLWRPRQAALSFRPAWAIQRDLVSKEKNKYMGPGVVMHLFNPSTWRAEASDVCDLEAGLVCTSSSRPTRGI